VSPLRIVSLVPSITELLIDLGLGPYVVGRTGFCTHPADAVGSIAKVGGTKAVQLDKIKALAPTHVVVNVDENERPTVEALRSWVPHIVVTHPQSPHDNLALIDQMLATFSAAEGLHRDHRSALTANAQRLQNEMALRLAALQNMQLQRPVQKVLYLIWREPWMTVARDTYISRMLALIGWQTWPDALGGNGIDTPGASRYPVLQGTEPWLGQIDRVLLSSEPYSFRQQHVLEVRQWLRSQGAPAKVQVQLVDGELLSWYGSRAVAGLDYLDVLSTGCAATPTAGSTASSLL
jgi:hypothetical protein